jgi:hypothetical protein
MHNLLRGLVESTTLVPPDLALMDDARSELAVSTPPVGGDPSRRAQQP